MIGSGTNTPWKIILALLYYIMCFFGFTIGFREGFAVLIVGTTFPFFVSGIVKGIQTKKYENFFVIPCWILTIIVALVIYPRMDTETVNTASVQTSEAVSSLLPATTDVPSSAPSVAPTAAPSAEPSAQPEAAAAENGDMVVYTGKSGSKYHKKDCPSLKKSKTIISMKLREAKEAGKTQCKRCFDDK
ncbi:MAG: PT domain-containing protein [Clostridia bacterium]|nr:PT domain-containing protein [Clostridia bacterium]